MTARILILLVTAMLVGGAAGQQGNTDVVKIKGTWIVTEAQGEADKLAGVKFIFGDGKCSVAGKDGKKDQTFAYKLDPSKNPKELDIIPDGAPKGAVLKAIYLLDGDSLKICLVMAPPRRKLKDGETPPKETVRPEMKRPTEFKESKDQVVIGLKRQNP